MPKFALLVPLAAALASAVLLYYSFFFVRLAFVETYPYGTLAVLPWACGIHGLAGLVLSLGHKRYLNPLRLKMAKLLLGLGLSGATIAIATLACLLLAFFLHDQVIPVFVLIMLAGVSLMVFLIIVAVNRFRAISPALTRLSVEDSKLFRHFTLLICVLLVSSVTLPVIATESVLRWYGRDLAAAATRSAETIAQGTHYCVLDKDGAQSFEALDKSRILHEILHKRWGFHGMNPEPIDPHFGIAVAGRKYWWSFRQRRFVYLPGIDAFGWGRVPQACL